jgi:hypothetical protein
VSKIYRFFTILFLIINVELSAQTGTWVESSASCLAVHISPEEAKNKALEIARSEAIKQVVGLKIVEETFRSASETLSDGNVSDFKDIFNRFNLTSSFGKIVEEEKRYTMQFDGAYPRYFCHLRAKVVEEIGISDQNFKVSILLNKNMFFDAGKAEEDKLKFKLWASQSCYFYLFNIMSSDSVQLILPNKYIPKVYFDAEKTEQEYEKQIINSGLEFNVRLPVGKNNVVEGLLLIALKDKIDFSSPNLSSDGFNIIPTYKAAMTDIMSWLVTIPLDKRVEAFATYEIRKRN